MTENIPPLSEEQLIGLMSDDAAEKYLEKLLKKITNQELADRKESELWERIDSDELTIQEACSEVLSFIKKREQSINRSGLEGEKSIDANTQKQRDALVYSIHLSKLTPDCFLGNGAVAEVYSIMSENRKLCVKIVVDYTKHAEENNIHQEARFLEKLHDFEKDGVRTPELKNKLSLIGLDALVMEELDAVNMARVIEGKDELPENFDMDIYFEKLKNYIMALHEERGVYHLDIAARNLMIDKKTGLPYVIDFGKSKFRDDFMGEKAGDFETIYEGKDSAGMAAAKAEIRRWLDGGKQPLTKLKF